MIEAALAKSIRLVAFDIDGVMTDGGIYLGDVDGRRLEFKRYEIQDGLGIAMLRLVHEMRGRGESGAVLSLLCDNGDRYLNTYHDDAWVQAQFGECEPAYARLVGLTG